MKKIIGLSLALFTMFSTVLSAQSKDTSFIKRVENGTKKTGKAIGKGAKKTGKAIGKGATTAGHKTAELAAKGVADVKDNIYKDKVGPTGQTIYINSHSKYYWIDKKGAKHFIAAVELKDKVD